MDLSYEDVAHILKMIDSSSIDDLHIEMNGLVLSIRRNGASSASSPERAAPGPATVPPATTLTPRPADGTIHVSAPMLGTFYRSPAPGEPPFVEAGTIVQPGTPLCIIEVMKLLNTITAERAGRVREVLVSDATMVEYGQVLMVLEPL